jgi:hypothetical protein
MIKKAQSSFSIPFLIVIIALLLLFSGWWILTGQTIYKAPDSDKDGLSDSDELLIGTDVNNPNTDGDRYLDGDDDDPLNASSAKIEYYKINEKEDYHIFNIGKNTLTMGLASIGLAECGSVALGVCAKNSVSVLNSIEKSLDDVIYTSSGEIIFSNIGDDHTNYINFNIVYRINEELLYEIPLEVGKVSANKKVTIPYSYDLRVEDIKYMFWDMIVNRKKIEVSVEKLDYERFG